MKTSPLRRIHRGGEDFFRTALTAPLHCPDAAALPVGGNGVAGRPGSA
jgi:hypothetical protein